MMTWLSRLPVAAAAPLGHRWPLAWGATAGGALLVIIVVLVARRRRGPDPLGSAGTRPDADLDELSGAWTVDRACRALATACAEWPRPLPAVGAVILGPQRVTVWLATPDEAPPPGWSADEHGRAWSIAREQISDAPCDRTLPAPWPTLVSLARTDAGRVLLHLRQADGVISLDGDETRALALARAWTSRLTASPWSAGIPVIRVGFAPDPVDGFTGLAVSGLAEAGAVLDGPTGGVLAFAAAPHGPDLAHVARLIGGLGPRWAVVAVGAVDARWRLTVAPDGTVETSVLDGPARLRA